ncbi:MAG: ribonuclease PH [Myxococcota bacterium]|nr:ribonuclease PH [Myxococcota bacterium]
MTQRPTSALRAVSLTPDFTDAPLASVLICCGDTRVLCTTSVEEKVPPFRLASGGGWMTAEYAMLPGATPRRSPRASKRGRPDGRSTEIQRLIGRSLRSAFDLDQLGPHTLTVDCDVLQADGGTRTAAITAGYVSARLAVERLVASGLAQPSAIGHGVAAVSVGIVGGVPTLDLDYILDSSADVDMNVVMDARGQLVELQGTAEKATFTRTELGTMLDLAESGIEQLRILQAEAVKAGLAKHPRAR